MKKKKSKQLVLLPEHFEIWNWKSSMHERVKINLLLPLRKASYYYLSNKSWLNLYNNFSLNKMGQDFLDTQ